MDVGGEEAGEMRDRVCLSMSRVCEKSERMREVTVAIGGLKVIARPRELRVFFSQL